MKKLFALTLATLVTISASIQARTVIVKNGHTERTIVMLTIKGGDFSKSLTPSISPGSQKEIDNLPDGTLTFQAIDKNGDMETKSSSGSIVSFDFSSIGE